MVRDVVTTIEPLAQKNANALEVHCPDGIGAMYADPTKVRQSLFNLLSNACKFTEGGKVRLDVQPVELAAVVRNAIETTRPAAEAKGVRLQRVLDPAAGPVSGDPNRL